VAGKGAKAQAAAGGHPGFKALVAAGVPAGALANASRNASPAAKARNPRLKKVKGKAKKSPPVQQATSKGKPMYGKSGGK